MFLNGHQHGALRSFAADFDEKFQLMLQPGARIPQAFEVSWARLRRVQKWDEDTNGETLMMPWLSKKHFGVPPQTSVVACPFCSSHNRVPGL